MVQKLEEYVIVRMDFSLMAMILNVSNHFGHFGSFLELSLQLLLLFVVVGVHVGFVISFALWRHYYKKASYINLEF